MPTFKLIVSYDGTDYKGWQIQPDAPTITQVLQNKFECVFKKTIKVVGTSRTDAGVHALGQVAKFTTDLDIDLNKLLRAWNNALPSDIQIRSIEHSHEFFNPRKDAQAKTYCYYLGTEKTSPFIGRYVHCPKYLFDLEKLNNTLSLFVGTHDFKNFCKFEEKITLNTIKTINSINMNYFKRFNVYQIKINGNSFLYNMIRRIIGASLDSAAGRYDISIIDQALRRQIDHTFNTAPSKGLVLHKIHFGQKI